MLIVFSLLCCVLYVGGFALLNRVFYALYRPLCKKINAHIATVCSHRVFVMLSTYAHFYFEGDYTKISDLPDQYLLISNHQSFLDIVAYMNYLGGKRLRFVAKKELADHVPLVSVMLKSDGHCLVQRKGGMSQAMKAMDRFAVRVNRNNWIPVLFPEGTRSRDGKVGQFYSAGFRRFLAGAPMPVVVAAIDGGWQVASIGRLFKNMRSGGYRIKVLKVFPYPQTKEEQLAVLAESKALIETQLAEWRAEKS